MPIPRLPASIAVAVAVAFTATSAIAQQKPDGIDVGHASYLRKLVPAERLEKTAAVQFAGLKRDAAAKRALAPDDHPDVIRLRAISKRIIAHAARFNPESAKWQWEVILIGSNQLNAFCMPGGKIAFYSGILNTLKLTDDEIAMVMGHEVAHALREHARERIAKSELTRLGATVAGALAGSRSIGEAFNLAGGLASLKFSRDDETEADVVGLDLAARAGYDPRAGITLWQKMSAAAKNAPPQWLSTHPSGKNRIDEIKKQLPKVMPLYEKARLAAADAPVAAPPKAPR
ncbi:MAG: M48 family metallopeptidase [Burkholderiales bacterium]